MIKIAENDKALLWRCHSEDGSEFFEVWIKIVGNYGKFKGQILIPKDEDFGSWAWCTYTLETARKIFEEISSGQRNIVTNSD